MDISEIVWLAVCVGFAGLGYFWSRVVPPRLEPHVRRWLKPLVEKLCPIFKMEPWLFEPIAPEDLPSRQRWFFETHTPSYIGAGFTHIGDFVLRRDREPSCVRYFLSRDGKVIGELTCYLGEQVIECVSVLLDGFYIETASTDCPQPPPASHGLAFFTKVTDDARVIIEYHADCVGKTAAERGTAAAPLGEKDIQAAINYGRQLSLSSLKRQGVLTELPEFLRSKTPLG